MIYNVAILGGTFDHLHAGHKAFIRFALSKSKYLLLGLTTNQYVREYKYHTNAIQTYRERKKMLEYFLSGERALQRVTIAPIDSVLYPRIWEELNPEVVIVTPDTQKGAEIVNTDRIKRGLLPLSVIIAPLISTEENMVISSSAIRLGKINNLGSSPFPNSWLTKEFYLPEKERHWFHKPFGILSSHIPIDIEKLDAQSIITVGDIVTNDFHNAGLHPKLSIIDFTVQRKKRYTTLQQLGYTGKEIVLHAENPPGHLTSSLFIAMKQVFRNWSQTTEIVICIQGEEDLAVLPVILMAPLDAILFYGQPHEGIVRVDITTYTKAHALTLMEKFVMR